MSHANLGWETFTGHVIRLLSLQARPLVFVLWGNHAKTMYDKWADTKNSNLHLVIKSAHPSPLSATKFLGTKPFSLINNFLTKQGLPVINFAITS